jgi:hypothetical protein
MMNKINVEEILKEHAWKSLKFGNGLKYKKDPHE